MRNSEARCPSGLRLTARIPVHRFRSNQIPAVGIGLKDAFEGPLFGDPTQLHAHFASQGELVDADASRDPYLRLRSVCLEVPHCKPEQLTFGAIVRWPVGLLERLRWSGPETGQSSFYGANIDSDLLGRFWVNQKSKGCPKRHPG